MFSRIVCLLLISAIRLPAEIQFSGFFTTPKISLFSLTDSATHTSSGWLAVGDSFEGYAVLEFNPSEERLTVKKDGATTRLRLRDSNVKDGKMVFKGTLLVGNGEDLTDVAASLFLDEENVYPLKNGGKLHLTIHRLPEGTLLYQCRFEVPGNDGKMRSIGSPSMVVRPGDRLAVKIGDLGFSILPERADR